MRVATGGPRQGIRQTSGVGGQAED